MPTSEGERYAWIDIQRGYGSDRSWYSSVNLTCISLWVLELRERSDGTFLVNSKLNSLFLGPFLSQNLSWKVIRLLSRGVREKMEVATLVFFLGGFFGQLSILVIRLRAILMLTTRLLSCIQLPPGCKPFHYKQAVLIYCINFCRDRQQLLVGEYASMPSFGWFNDQFHSVPKLAMEDLRWSSWI